MHNDLFFPGFFLLGLAMAAGLVLASPWGRNRLGWGRARYIPITSVGATGIVLAFLIMAGTLLAGAWGWLADDFFILVGLLSGFVIFIASGLWDTLKHERRRKTGKGSN